MAASTDNPYAVLGVAERAPDSVIRKKYLEIAKANHPDKGGDAEVMGRATEAFSQLSTPAKRKRADDRLKLMGLWPVEGCRRCEGTGVVYKSVGFTGRRMMACPICKGAGR
jgi:DnaJ-class molecular chaperone